MSASYENSTFIALYCDILDRMNAFLKTRSTIGVDQATIRSGVESALREIATYRDWKCMKRIWRVHLKATQTTGTVTYDSTTQQLTLTGATWPTDAIDYTLRIGTDSVTCEVEEYVSPTILKLKSPNTPSESIATGVTYVLGKPYYALPANFSAAWTPTNANATFIGRYIPFEQWYLYDRFSALTGTSKLWTIGTVPGKYNVQALYVYPWPSVDEEYDLLMKFRPRRLAVSGKESWNYSGTVSVGLGGTTVTGSTGTGSAGVLFRDLMIGSVIRFSDSSTIPTDTNGSNPYVCQATILDVDSTSSPKTLTIDTPSPYALTSVKYVVSDPLTLDEALYDAFLRNCEKHLASDKDLAAAERRFSVALLRAKIADSAVKQRQYVGDEALHYTRLSDYKSRPWTGG